MSGGELERIVKLDRVPETLRVEADAQERTALAQRFDLAALHMLTAELHLEQSGDAIDVRGRLVARFDQHCAVSNEPFANALDEPIAVRFVRALPAHGEDEEIEFAPDAPDEIEYDGSSFDLGESVAQSFGLALDPYAVGPTAETARREAGIVDETAPSGPFAALAALKKD